MKPFSRPGSHKNSYRWAPFIVSGIALLLALATTYYVAKMTEAKAGERFDLAAQQISNGVEDLVNGHVTLLHAVRGLAYASPSVSRQQFRDYVASLDLPRRFPGTQGIGFSVRVPADKKEELVRTMRDQGVEDFHIHPETARAEYHAIVYLEPLDKRNQAAVGYDMFTEPVRRAAMEKARDTGELSASGRVTLVQEIDEPKQAGF
ncbi:MAG TPA: CHASE domain-containing protein, partial [Candidatus Angelobacter sp.]|nr:CHASE domain-containing protein [Candidatus Angelobacter sp.]